MKVIVRCRPMNEREKILNCEVSHERRTPRETSHADGTFLLKIKI